MNYIAYVKCSECGEEHWADSGEVEALNVEEDYMGRDVLTFVCPKTGNTTSSLIYLTKQ